MTVRSSPRWIHPVCEILPVVTRVSNVRHVVAGTMPTEEILRRFVDDSEGICIFSRMRVVVAQEDVLVRVVVEESGFGGSI